MTDCMQAVHDASRQNYWFGLWTGLCIGAGLVILVCCAFAGMIRRCFKDEL